MKNYILTTATALVLLTSCHNGQKEAYAKYQRDSLLIVIEERESTVNEFVASFYEVEKNLNDVSAKQRIIRLNSNALVDLNANQKTRINAEIKAINELMDVNSKTIKQLHKKLNRSNKKNERLAETIVLLNEQLNQKYDELTELNKKLYERNVEIDQLRTAVDVLFTQNLEQTQSISDKDAELHTAYYIIGSSRDFQQWNLIDNEGGFLGIGQTSKMSNNVDLNMFTKIDNLETTNIPINSKHVRIITTHPTGSFSLVKTGNIVNSIMISDPLLFWSISKYLVITN